MLGESWASLCETLGAIICILEMFWCVCFAYSQWFRTLKYPPKNPSLLFHVVPVQSQVAELCGASP